MKRVYLLILIICSLGFGSIEPRPTAKYPGSLSTKTSVPYNSSSEKFWILNYDGFREDKVLLGKYSFDDLISNEKGSQRKKFDSLGSGKFKTIIQPPSGVHLTRNLFIDEAEVANIDFHEFLFYIERDSSEEFLNKVIPKLKVYDPNDVIFYSLTPHTILIHFTEMITESIT
ncbi:MAG: hypothetical protein HYZ42_09205 [Bacteroidetes bacterium]|nr:hypothetical protein [Bacteroidota bacterium]